MRSLPWLLLSLLVSPHLAAAEPAHTAAPAESESSTDSPAQEAKSEREEGERSEREEELFREEAPEEGDARDAALFGEASEDSEETGLLDEGLDLISRVNEKDDLLQLGGQLYMRMDWSILERGEPDTYPLNIPGLLDLYVDVRPSERLRAFASGRVTHTFSANSESTSLFGESVERTRVVLDQLWLKFDVARHVFFTLGQQPIRWGHARFWNPTDFLNSQFKDPLAVFDERLGVSLIKVHIPIESLGWNLYAIANIDGADSGDDIGGALRAEFVFGTTEIAASFAARKDSPYQIGLSLSSGFWWIDAWAEVALLHGVNTPRWEGSYDLATFSAPDAVDISDGWWPRASVGFEIAIPVFEEDALYLGVEYAYNGLGYDDASLYPWLIANQAFVPFYVGKHYGAVYAALPAPGRLDEVTFILSQLANLSDESFILRFDTQVRVLSYLSLNVYAAVHFGALGEFRYGQRIDPNPEAAALWSNLDPEAQEALLSEANLSSSADVTTLLEEGLDIPSARLDLGVGLRLRL